MSVPYLEVLIYGIDKEVRVGGTEPDDDLMDDNLISSLAIAIPISRGASVWVWYLQ